MPDDVRRADAHTLVTLMERLSGHSPVMWGPSIVGFGEYRYRYESGREGRMARIGFSPRAKELVIYLADGPEQQGAMLARLGRHRAGKSCLYVRRLAEIDQAVLEELIASSLRNMRDRYPEGA